MSCYKKPCNERHTSLPQPTPHHHSRIAISIIREKPRAELLQEESPAEIMVEGLISFVYGAIKKRRAMRKTTHYEHLSSLGSSPPTTRGLPERFLVRGAAPYNAQTTTQSCRFVVATSLAQELHLWRGDDRPEGL
jgi:hypothetical protein